MMCTEKQIEQLLMMIEERVRPFKLAFTMKDKLTIAFSKYNYEFIKECILISSAKYLEFDRSNNPTRESVSEFIDKIIGIAYNRSHESVSNKISHIDNSGVRGPQFSYWNSKKARELLWLYVDILRVKSWTDKQIISELDSTCLKRLLYSAKSWTDWRSSMECLIEEAMPAYESNA